MDAQPSRPPWWLAPLFLAVVLAAYQPAWHGELLWDDDRHVTSPELRSAEGLWRIWTDLGATQQYYPVVHSAFWVQHGLWGDTPIGYHLVNIALHALAAFLLVRMLFRLRVPGAVLAGVLFALHPVQVESVAWISELKNTLSTVFYLLAADVYLRFDASRRPRVYALALAVFVLALESKSVTATLPVALLVVFWWQRGTLDLRRDVFPLAPFVMLGLAAGLFTAWVEHAYIGARGSEFELSLLERLLLAGRVPWFYLASLLWPVGLLFTYPRWELDPAALWQWTYPLATLAVVGAAWWWRARSRTPLAVVLLFLLALLPALGFINVYPFRFSFVADHFQYLATMPALAAAAAIVTRLAARKTAWSPVAATVALSLALGLPLGMLTWRQSQHYADAETLYRATIEANPRAWMAHGNLGKVLMDDRPAEARRHIEEALRLNPRLAEAHNNLGMLLHQEGRLEEAISRYREATRLEPALAQAHNNLCGALWHAGRPDDALPACQQALGLRPEYPEARFNAGAALRLLGRPAEALPHLQAATRDLPGHGPAAHQLALAYHGLGRLPDAMAAYREAIVREPGFAQAHNDLGAALVQAGRTEEAIARFEAALALRPDFTDAAFNLAIALMAAGRTDEAVDHLEAVVRVRPGDSSVRNNLGVGLMRLGRARDAVVHLREAVRLNPDSAEARANLEAALKALGGGGGSLPLLTTSMRRTWRPVLPSETRSSPSRKKPGNTIDGWAM